jgi:hypothetical protein
MKRIRASRGWTKAFAGVVVGALAAGAVVQAQTTDGTIHGCVELSSHNLQIDSASNIQSQGGCVPGVSVELVWRDAGSSGQGPQGPQGPAGPQGAKGDRGDSGTGGTGGTLHNIHRTIGPSIAATKQGSARCDSGQHVVSGGYTLAGDAKGVQVKGSRPSGTTAWFARAQQSRKSADWSLVVYAVCST